MGRERKRLLFIGRTQVGKSTKVKMMILHRHQRTKEPVIILDPNNQKTWWEYPQITLEQLPKLQGGVYRIVTMKYKDFFNTVYNKWRPKKGAQVVGEDASNYLTPQQDMDIYPNLIGLRHPDHNMDFTGITHSIYRTPGYIIEQANEVILFKTGDVWNKCTDRIPDNVKEEFKKAFDEVNADPDPYAYRRIIISKTGNK